MLTDSPATAVADLIPWQDVVAPVTVVAFVYSPNFGFFYWDTQAEADPEQAHALVAVSSRNVRWWQRKYVGAHREAQ